MRKSLQASVVIPTYNCARYLRAAITSAINQTLPAREIIVVDDCSSDDTELVLEEFGQRIQILRHEKNLGLPAARNTGIRASSGDLVGFLDADDVWDHNMIAKQTLEFTHHKELGMCFTRLVDCDAELNPIAEPRDFRRRTCERVFDELYMTAFPMPPSTVFVKRNIFDSVGYFDETMLKKQDYECWLRISMLYPISCIAEVLCSRRIHPDSLTLDPNIERNLYYESRCFELCALAAKRMGVQLPMPAAERQALSQRRRMLEMLRYGDLRAARVYNISLARTGQLSRRDKVFSFALCTAIRARTILRLFYRRVTARLGLRRS